MFGDGSSRFKAGRFGVGLGLSWCVAAQGWAAPPPPPELIAEIQHEFVRLYDLPDSVLALQVEPTLEIFPEYRADLVKYLGQGASPERQKLLGKVSKASKEELAAWFETDAGKIGITAAVAVGAVAAIASHKGGGGGHHAAPAKPVSPPADPAPVVPAPDPVAPVVPPTTPVEPPVEPPVVPPVVEPEPEPQPVPEDFRTEEFRKGRHLGAVGAEYAYARGGTGKGVVIAIKDTGVDINDPELRNQIAPGGDKVSDNGPAMRDTATHGTAVAKAAAAAKNGSGTHGVAYDAKILPIIALDESHEKTFGSSDSAQVDREIQYGANISNNSWQSGWGDDYIRQGAGPTYQRGVDAGIIYVWAAGNNGNAQPSTQALLPVKVPGLAGQWLAVVGVDTGSTTGAISRDSNRCGAAKDWCIAAPWQIPVSTPDGGVSEVAGTSIAAPQVSGGLAVLMQLFPTLTPKQIVQRMLVSANKQGIYAEQDIYGQGVMDLRAASAPIGALMIEANTGQVITLNQAAIAESTAMGNALRSALSKVQLTLKDSLDTPFQASGELLATEQAGQQSHIDTERYLARMEQESRMQKVVTENGLTLNYGAGGEGSGLEAIGEIQALAPVGERTAVSATFNSDPSWNQGLKRLDPKLANNGVTQALSNPYLSQGEQASGAGLNQKLGQNWQAGVQAQTARAKERFIDEPAKEHQQSVQAELAYVADNGIAATVQVGVLNEQQRLLGSQSETMIGRGNARTLFNGFNLNVPLNENWSVYGRYNTGRTRLKGNGWASGSQLDSDSFTLGFNGQPSANLQVGALAYQPLRIKGGTLSAQLPTGVNADNSVAWNNVDLALKPDGRHMEYEAYLRYELPAWAMTFKGSVLRIEDYANQAGNNDSMVLFNAGMKY